jgi:Flp pilus assembly protein TadB
MIFLIAFVALAFAYYFMQKDKIRRQEKNERIKNKQQQLLDMLRANKEKDSSK